MAAMAIRAPVRVVFTIMLAFLPSIAAISSLDGMGGNPD
jgi:hypothetical protein